MYQFSKVYIINYRFLTTKTNLKAFCIFRCLFTTSSADALAIAERVEAAADVAEEMN